MGRLLEFDVHTGAEGADMNLVVVEGMRGGAGCSVEYRVSMTALEAEALSRALNTVARPALERNKLLGLIPQADAEPEEAPGKCPGYGKGHCICHFRTPGCCSCVYTDSAP